MSTSSALPPVWSSSSASASSGASAADVPAAHSGTSVGQFHRMHYAAALFPLTGGLMLYGWRALGVVGAVVASAAVAVPVWRRVGAAGRQLSMSHVVWHAALLGLMLPPHLVRWGAGSVGWSIWPILPAAGVLLVMASWTLGGLGAGRVHPVVVAWLLLAALFQAAMAPRYVLQRHRVVVGSLFDAAPADVRTTAGGQPWVTGARAPEHDAMWLEPASDRLAAFTRGDAPPERGLLRMTGMLRDHLPPLEDLIVGGQPGPVGTTSAVAVIIGGLFLLYRGLVDFRIPLLGVTTALVLMLVLPIPARIGSEPQWRWLAMREPDVGWPTAVTLANYEIMASPLLFAAFFLATSTSVRPMARRARAIYAIAFGALAAVCQLYASVAMGPYLALLFAGLLAPTLDKWFRPRALV
jgi:Na+-translocating ferredoxin:NAD+ oxidoreductase RnfD subunit